MNKQEKQNLQSQYKKQDVKSGDKLLIKLKQHGGEAIVRMPEPEEHMKMLLKDGRLFDCSKLKIQMGEPSKCHTNAARLWANDEELQLVTGYALSNRLWLQHSWAWNGTTGELIETTNRRKKYFGVALNDLQALKFATENVPEFKDPSKSTTRIGKCALKTMQLLSTVGPLKFAGILRGGDDPEKYLKQQP